MSNPIALMVAGPNGSGKTTLTESLREAGVSLGTYINPDEIAKGLAGTYAERVMQAQVLADEQRASCLSSRTSFSFETVMSHPSKPAFLRQAREAGFETHLYFVATEDVALNIDRVRQRVDLGGHDVPVDRIAARYERSIALLGSAIAHADVVVLFDNSVSLKHGGKIVLRPFARFDCQSDPQLEVMEPIPQWGREAVDLLQAIALNELARTLIDLGLTE